MIWSGEAEAVCRDIWELTFRALAYRALINILIRLEQKMSCSSVRFAAHFDTVPNCFSLFDIQLGRFVGLMMLEGENAMIVIEYTRIILRGW